MPELPEVETIRRDLSRVILQKKIINIVISKPKLIKNTSTDYFKKNLINQKITAINRRGKLLYFSLSNHKFLLIHLKMTGQLIYQDRHKIVAGGHNFPPIGPELPNKYSHIYFKFTDQSTLYFNDQRQFGYLQIVDKQQLNDTLQNFGIEPLCPDFTLSNFSQLFINKTVSLKNVLLNQRLISGIGNIYADEICFQASIKPTRRVSQLSPTDIKKIFKSTQKIITAAIKHRGTTFSNYRDGHGHTGNYTALLQVYGRQNQPCYRCHTKIKKIKHGGRGTHFCPMCQK